MTHTSIATDHVAESEFRLGRVISRSASLLRRRLPAYFIMSLAASLPLPLLAGPEATQALVDFTMVVLLLGWIFDLPAAFLADAYGLAAWAVAGIVLAFVLGMLSQAIIIHAVFADLRRQPVRLALSFTAALRRFPAVVGLALAAALLTLLGLILLVIPGLILWTMWFVAVAACVVERLRPGRALHRSQNLTRGHRWKLFGLAVLLVIAAQGSSLVESGLVRIATPVAGLVGYLVWTGLWAALSSVVTTVAYHDLRAAKEGADIDPMVAVFD